MSSYSGQHPLFNQPYSPSPPQPDHFSPLPLATTASNIHYASPPLAGSHSPLAHSYGSGGYPDHAYPAYPSQSHPIKDERSSLPTRQDNPAGRIPKEKGKWRAFWSTYKTRNQLIFLALIAIQAVTVLAMIALCYGTIRHAIGDITTTQILDSDPELQSVATYLSLFIIAVVFEVLITLDAMQQKNIMSLFVLCFFQIAMLVYSSVLPSQLQDALNNSSADTPTVQRLCRAYAIVIPSTVGACTIAMSGMLWPLYHEFGWDVFKRIGADIQIRRYFMRYQVFVCLLKFDAFFFIGFAVQFLVLVSGTPTVEFVLTIVALPMILIALALFAITVRLESRTGVWVSFLVQAAGMGYFVYKLIRIYQASSAERYDSAKATLTIFSVISLLMLIVTFVMMGLCMVNFDKGLRERIPGYAFNGGRPLLSSRPSVSAQGRQPSNPHHPYTADIGSPGALGEGGREKPPGLGRQGSSYGFGERTETRMSID
ncbi:hypothetical protein JCM11641_003601 [Rhodosporidiobolus odoratus]